MTSHLCPAQIRGARAMLDWSMIDLANAATVSVSTIKRTEELQPCAAVTGSKLAAIRQALEAAGVLFLPDEGEGPGLRLLSPDKARFR